MPISFTLLTPSINHETYPYAPDSHKYSQGIVQFMHADATRLTARTYNLNAISFTPGEIAAAIRTRIPSFTIKYVPDFRQAIADSWPRSLDDSKVMSTSWGK